MALGIGPAHNSSQISASREYIVHDGFCLPSRRNQILCPDEGKTFISSSLAWNTISLTMIKCHLTLAVENGDRTPGFASEFQINSIQVVFIRSYRLQGWESGFSLSQELPSD